MKKIISLALILLFITACGGKKLQIYLKYNDRDIILNTVYDEEVLGKANDFFESDNCAFGDRDVTYMYNDIEIETYGNEHNDLIIYSIVFTSENVKTNEGIGLYDSIDDAIKVYGNNFVKEDNKYTYNSGPNSLIFITQNDIIESIEYALNNLK